MVAAIQNNSEFFAKFGGHPQACGFTLKSLDLLEAFKKRFNEVAAEQTQSVELVPQINIDSEVDLDDISWPLYDLLQKFEPFGMNNEEPKYVARGLTITGIMPVGQDGKHLKLMIKHNSQIVRKTIGFGLGDINRHKDDWKNTLHVGDKIDMAFCVEANEWNGNRELQMTILDIKKSDQ
ncbi:MAG: hypothetical protein NT034_01555 [Candidatus Magasanikbacteria bacterium]|nr:hypothetical protein [Candidatus Magasanikbacteria bacterium]